jgi:hypothetical protein
VSASIPRSYGTGLRLTTGASTYFQAIGNTNRRPHLPNLGAMSIGPHTLFADYDAGTRWVHTNWPETPIDGHRRPITIHYKTKMGLYQGS